MTTYAYDPTASTLVALWPTGDGAVAHRVARVPRGWEAEPARRTAGALTRLSERLWVAYAEQEVAEVGSDELATAVRCPNQPVGDLLLTMEDGRVEAAHHLGRILSRAPGRAMRDAVVLEVVAESEAVRSADAGDLTGRAQQAVVHCRPDAPDEQLVAAHALLYDDPLGPEELVTAVEPHAAAVATLRWLRAAAGVSASLLGHTGADVIALAEAIDHEALPIAQQVLERVANSSDADVVRELLQEGVVAAHGYFVVCPEQHPEPDGPERGHRVVTTVLDPHEPGRCLVDGLVRGIHGCFRVYLDEVTTRERPGVDPRLTGPRWAAELRRRFVDEVRHAVRAAP